MLLWNDASGDTMSLSQALLFTHLSSVRRAKEGRRTRGEADEGRIGRHRWRDKQGKWKKKEMWEKVTAYMLGSGSNILRGPSLLLPLSPEIVCRADQCWRACSQSSCLILPSGRTEREREKGKGKIEWESSQQTLISWVLHPWKSALSKTRTSTHYSQQVVSLTSDDKNIHMYLCLPAVYHAHKAPFPHDAVMLAPRALRLVFSCLWNIFGWTVSNGLQAAMTDVSTASQH